MAIQLDSIVLPGDLAWVDEFAWLPVAQQVEVASNGALLVEESAQLAGRPITLEAQDVVWVYRDTVVALRALAATPLTSPLELTLHDGRTFDVRFRHSDGVAVEATPVRHIAPLQDADPYHLTLRLMQV